MCSELIRFCSFDENHELSATPVMVSVGMPFAVRQAPTGRW